MTTEIEDEHEAGRKLFAQNCEFVLAAADPAQFPVGRMPEVAFIGRSNVGKSSLINALTGRKSLARASNTPGRTQQVVFFNLGQRLMLVDLPGYGHAKAPHEEKDHWTALVQYYLNHRPTLKCICLLMDGRHGAKANDLEMLKFLDRAAVIYQVVLTKSDQVRKSDDDHTAAVEALIKRHPAARAGVMLTSAEKQTGIPELRTFLTGFAG
jgi:GTP-binding protein